MAIRIKEQNHHKSPLDICEAAWREIESTALRFDSAGFPDHPVIRFTRGVLKLPWNHWVAVVEALQEGRWKEAPYPIAYIRTVAIRQARILHWEASRGSYAGEGKRVVVEIEPIPEPQRSGPCWKLLEKGTCLTDPHCTPAPVATRRHVGQMIPESPVFSAGEEQLRGEDDTVTPTPFERFAYQNWWEAEVTYRHDAYVDWGEVAGAMELDPDEEALFSAVLRSTDGSDARETLGWDYAQFERTRKRLKRKRAAMKNAINDQREKNI